MNKVEIFFESPGTIMTDGTPLIFKTEIVEGLLPYKQDASGKESVEIGTKNSNKTHKKNSQNPNL